MSNQLRRTFSVSWNTVRRCSSSAGGFMDTEPATNFLKMEGLTEKQIARRREFLEAEKVWDAQIQWEKLSPEEVNIITFHKRAVNNGHFTYDDPKLKRKVMTRLRHFLRGKCCGNACRHCIYNQENVPDELKGVKIFNTAFWIERSPPDELTPEETERREPHFV